MKPARHLVADPDAEVTRPDQLEPRLLSMRNAARYCDEPFETFRQRVARKTIPCRTVSFGKNRKVVKADLDAYIDSQIAGESR